MKDYKIEIKVTDAGGIYTAESLKEAQEIAENIAENMYNQLQGCCGVEVVSVEEVKK